MNILSLENVGKNYGVKPLFENATFGIEETDKIGIIGANGSGKTTLLKVIAGTEQPDTGKVVRTQGKTLAYLAQNPTIDENATVLEMIFAASSGVMKLIQDYETACHDLAIDGANPKTLERVSAAGKLKRMRASFSTGSAFTTPPRR
jgi:ATP-binding cassette subfamily F protein uup